MNKLGYSHLLDDRNSEKLYSLNDSIEKEMQVDGSVMSKFEDVTFEMKGLYLDKNLSLLVNYRTKDGKSGQKEFSSHVDEGAIELHSEYIQAYFGEDSYNEVKEDLDAHCGTFESDYIKENEPDLYNQLAEAYLLSCSPDVNGGAEFTDQDKIFFKEILDSN